MKLKKVVAVVAVLVLLVSAGVFAMNYYGSDNDVPEEDCSVAASANTMTARFTLIETDIPSVDFSMLSEDGELIIHINDNVPVYFEDGINVRDVLEPEQTLAEVLDGRRLVVEYTIVLTSWPAQTTPVRITVLYEDFVTLPEENDENELPILIGEIVVNNVILEGALAPFWFEAEDGDFVMVPLRVVAEALGYEVFWNAEDEGIRLGVGINLWIGNTEAHVGKMAPIELYTAPQLVGSRTFVSLDFFRSVLNQTAYVFEGQVVIETYSDMS